MTAALPSSYRRVVLARRPPGEPVESDFRIEAVPMPTPGTNQLLVRVVYLSLDPYMRGRMREVTTYAKPIGIGEVMEGGTVGEVVASNNPAFKVGDIVEERLGWQEYGLSNGHTLRRIDPALAPISTANGILGTVVVSAASGAVGQVVGQLARISGCRVVGIAGGLEKCAFLRDTLGFDAAIDYKAEGDLEAALQRACPNGIDVYFDNVGGPVTDAVIPLLNFWARIPLCGSISAYNVERPEMGPRLLWPMVGRRVTLRGFIVSDFAPRFEPARRALGELVRTGRFKYKEDIVDGIERAPRAFIGLLRGENFGKLLVRMGAST